MQIKKSSDTTMVVECGLSPSSYCSSLASFVLILNIQMSLCDRHHKYLFNRYKLCIYSRKLLLILRFTNSGFSKFILYSYIS